MKEFKFDSNQIFLSNKELKSFNINKKVIEAIFNKKIVNSFKIFNRTENIFQEFYLNKEHEKYHQIKDVLDSIDSELRNNKMINLKSLLASDYMLYGKFI